MSPDEYIAQRVDDQIGWYDRKSRWNQRWYKGLQVVSIVCAALIPFLVGYVGEATPALKVIVGMLGLVVAAIAGISGLYRFHEHWIEYRTTCESLRHEKYLFLTGSGAYQAGSPFPAFVTRIEGLISKENSHWGQEAQPKAKAKAATG